MVTLLALANPSTVLSRMKAEAFFCTSRVCHQASIQDRLQFETGFYATAGLSSLPVPVVAFLLH